MRSRDKCDIWLFFLSLCSSTEFFYVEMTAVCGALGRFLFFREVKKCKWLAMLETNQGSVLFGMNYSFFDCFKT